MRNEIIERRGYAPSIQGSDLSLEISSYTESASYLAERLAAKGRSVCELCCGIGVSLIEYSRYFDNVIGVDNDSTVIENARKNLEEAQVVNHSLICGDINDPKTLWGIEADIVVYDIPYWSDHEGDLTAMNPDLKLLTEAIRMYVTDDIVIYAAPHVDFEIIDGLFEICEYQEVWINGRHDRNFIYLGNTIEKRGKTKIELSIVDRKK